MFLQWNHLDLNPSSWNLLWNYFKAATMYHPEPFLLQEKRSQILFCYSMVFDKPVLSLISISQTYKTFNNPSTQTELIRLEKAMAPHSSTLAWKIPWLEGPGRLQSMGSQRVGTTKWLHFPFSLSCIGKENGNPLQCSCLENPRDSGAWWAAVSGVAQSRTRLKRLSSSSSSTQLALPTVVDLIDEPINLLKNWYNPGNNTTKYFQIPTQNPNKMLFRC